MLLGTFNEDHYEQTLIQLFQERLDYDYLNGYEDIPASNVLRFWLDNGSWFAIRPSGTEPKIKFYYGVVGRSLEDADAKSEAFGEQVLAMINGMLK